MKRIDFLAGLPRSGSTVLTKILCQHPELFATSTSPLIDYIGQAANHLHEIQNNHAYGHIVDVRTVLSTTASSFFSFTDKPIIIDKSRGWTRAYESVLQDLNSSPKMIITLRPIDEVITSFYHVLKKSSEEEPKVEEIYKSMVEGPLHDLINFQYKEQCCVVTYSDLIHHKKHTLNKINKYLNVSDFDYDFNNIKDDSPEDDSKWGIKDLHTIRKELKVEKKDPKEVLNNTEIEFCNEMTRQLYEAFNLEVPYND